jgi:hypothetical protein
MCALVSVVFSMSLLGEAQTQPITKNTEGLVRVKAASVSRVTPAGAVARVEFVNQSHKRIVAYTASVSCRYTDGELFSIPVTTDMVWALSLRALGFPEPQEARFGPGEVSVVTVTFPPSASGGVPSIEASVEMVAFDDKSAIGDPKHITALRSSRLREAESLAELLDDVESLQSAAPRRRKEAFEDILGKLQNGPPEESQKVKAARLRHASMLRSMVGPLVADSESLRQASNAYSARRKVLLEHIELTGQD